MFYETQNMIVVQAQEWDQRAFRSFLVRGWVDFNTARGFYLTQEGLNAGENFRHANIHRADPSAPLTSYFDINSWGAKSKRALKEKEVHANV
jgi:hypothetical protein